MPLRLYSVAKLKWVVDIVTVRKETCMTGMYRILCTALGVVGAGLALWLTPAQPTADAAPQTAGTAVAPTAPAPPLAKGRFVGAGSCAAAACHGAPFAPEPKTIEQPIWNKGSEYSIWVGSDRHAQAYAALYSHRSGEIVHKLGLKPAPTEERCLKCHSVAADPCETVTGRKTALADGVSCEACHGAAEHWLEPHKRHDFPGAYGSLDWKSLSSAQKAEWGFEDTESILARTRICLRCHIGSEGRDVDHDLIAAGHPRLYFEMSAYLNKLPAHWDRARDRQRHPALDARAWTVGQFAAGEAGLGLLAQRSSAKSPAPWPEFAEYACFDCHHDLTGSSWRQEPDPNRLPGRYHWGTWNFAFIEGLVRTREGTAAADGLKSDLDRLKSLMAQPNPPKIEVAQRANKLRGNLNELARVAAQDQYNADDLQRLLMFLAHEAAPAAIRDWETSTQLYLALAAIAQAQRDVPTSTGYSTVNPLVFDELQGIRDLLRFPKPDGALRFSSPVEFGKQQRIDELSNRWEQLKRIIEAK
jgi:hypothetical protein